MIKAICKQKQILGNLPRWPRTLVCKEWTARPTSCLISSWCSICLSTLGDTNDLAKEQSGKDYVVLSVVSPTFNGEKSADDFKEWYKSLDYKDFPVLIDNKGELLKEYGIRSYPSALFVGSDGSLAKTHIGYMSKEDIEKTLKEIK